MTKQTPHKYILFYQGVSEDVYVAQVITLGTSKAQFRVLTRQILSKRAVIFPLLVCMLHVTHTFYQVLQSSGKYRVVIVKRKIIFHPGEDDFSGYLRKVSPFSDIILNIEFCQCLKCIPMAPILVLSQ